MRELRRALAQVLATSLVPSPAPVAAPGWLLSQAAPSTGSAGHPGASGAGPDPASDRDLAASSAEDAAERQRLIALVELARGGDKEAFGQLYDHYQPSVHRFLYYRVGSVQLAEDLTAETFFRALRRMNGFRWQGRDFGAWLMTIARNLATDHFKSGRARLELVTDDERTLDAADEGPEGMVLAQLTNEALLDALHRLPQDQQDCLVMRFLQGLSLAETAEAMERSSGAIKQLQLRAVRHLASLLPEDVR
ncbi:sigma-70 family RNA polymerase sigma factor [Nocardioides mangrovicus]|uniref:Sigma-70 family RNA polymerase sigma factor n=1 Tax=Nocardioides mangrovicus TaxID=2478913 RepID=A0A3L8P8I8_9ACTN|nr:sigma-70 family RNA polymerase sigma factor [Nocardioides mangrovicus]